MASQAKTIEAKKDEFRAYLEKTGVVDQLTKLARFFSFKATFSVEKLGELYVAT